VNRALQWINLVGVLALAALCAVQWRVNRRVNLQVIALEQTGDEQAAQIAERDKTIKSYVADLDEFRQRLKLAESQLTELDDKLRLTVRERDQLVVDRNALIKLRDELKASLEKWQAAVAERDAALAKATDQIKALAADRNEAVARFNELAEKYNGIVKDPDKSRAAASRPSGTP
jgi:chromosome segregation ATPase